MPPIKTYRRQWRRFKRKYKGTSNYLATRPRMMPRTLAFKRMNQVSSKVFWFKVNGELLSDAAGNRYSRFLTRDLDPAAIAPVGWTALKSLYDQYKVLAIKLRLFPSNVGIESDSAIFASNALLRGDTVVWSDQRFDAAVQPPTSISEIINNASAKMINSRRPYSRTLYRPRGQPTWGDTQGPNLDSWNGSIELLVNNASPAPAVGNIPVLYYYTLQYKVLVRGRTQL